MGNEGRTSDTVRESTLRVAALAVVIGGHLVLLLLLMRPVVPYRDRAPPGKTNWRGPELHLLLPARSPSRLPTLAVHRLRAPTAHSHRTLPMQPRELLVVQQATRAGTQLPKALLLPAPNAGVMDGNASNDRTFEDRLHDAQRGRTIRGLPGSDSALVKGIRLVDPMSQGIGSVMRTTQRALGVTNNHCIDVDVLRHLSPEDLGARHISADDIDKADEKYGCSKPLGISF